jgi:hypothetical protein
LDLAVDFDFGKGLFCTYRKLSRTEGIPMPPTPPSGLDRTSALDFDSISEQMQRVRTLASALLDKAESTSSVTDIATAVETAAAAMKVAAEMDKTRSELTKVNEEIFKLKHENETAAKRERSDWMRDYAAALGPLVAIITLAVTLVAQNRQFLRSESDKREDALKALWFDTMKSPSIGALQMFLRIPEYRDQATEQSVNYMRQSTDPTVFASLFGPALTPVTWSNVDRVVQLDRDLRWRASQLYDKAWDEAKRQDDPSKLTKEERPTYDYVQHAVPLITAQLGGVLRTPRPPGGQIRLWSTYFEEGDWKGINFAEANLEDSWLSYTDLQDAEFKGVTRFVGAQFNGTAWWEVKSINGPFLEYLKINFPFKPGLPYGPRYEIYSQEKYDAGIRRLTSQLK